jgi:hypothetical protein
MHNENNILLQFNLRCTAIKKKSNIRDMWHMRLKYLRVNTKHNPVMSGIATSENIAGDVHAWNIIWSYLQSKYTWIQYLYLRLFQIHVIWSEYCKKEPPKCSQLCYACSSFMSARNHYYSNFFFPKTITMASTGLKHYKM